MKNVKWILAAPLALALSLPAVVASAQEMDVERSMSADVQAIDAERTTAQELAHWESKVAKYKRSGPAIKTGKLRRAEMKVADLRRELERQEAALKPAPAPSAEAVALEERAKRIKRTLFGAGYKTGLVQRAEAKARAHGSDIGQTKSNIVASKWVPSKTAVRLNK